MVTALLTDPALTGTASAAFTSIGPPLPLTRAQRVRRFGVDCSEGLEWTAGWEPGGEYVKQLVIKNVTTKVMKLRYKLPKSKYFSMAFPETIQLMPGLSHTLPVAFRPIKLEEYDDCVQFWNEKGSFIVPVRAWVPSVSTYVPENLDFGFCPVQETAVKSFAISNPGEMPVTFSWACDEPFVLMPSSGSMAPGASINITARFTPKDASVSVAQCVCNIPEHRPHVMRIGGIGKYPFLSCSKETIDCGAVLTGSVHRSQFKLANKSLVHARFNIVRRENDVAPVFTISPTSGVVPPDGELDVSVIYQPTVTGTYTRDHYDILTPSGSTVTVEAIGEAIGPLVELSKTSINFGDVPIETPRRSVGRVLEIFNRSVAPVAFQLHDVDANGIFSMSATSGVVPAGLSVFVNMHFSPMEPGNYYRRVYVLVANQAPLVVDVIGTGYTDKRRPMTLALKDVRSYLSRERQGLHLLNPEDIEARAVEQREAMARGEEVEETELTGEDSGIAFEKEVMGAIFRGSSSPELALYFEEECVDFGACSRLRVGEQRTVRLFNRTNGKVSVNWVVPNGYIHGGARDSQEPVFAISPASIDVLPKSSAGFKIQFRPKSDQQYYCQRLECVASFKTMRSFRLVNENNMTPPWTLVLTAHGHTFPPLREHFISKPRLSHRTLNFPACHAGDVAYQTVSLSNDGDTPMHFSVAPDPAGTFSVVPCAGVVTKGSAQLLAVRFHPRAIAPYEHNLAIVLNHHEEDPLRMQLLGAGSRASLHIAHNGRLFLPSTCVGASSRAAITITNPSRLPVAFEWDLSNKNAAAVLAVSPAAGVLQGRESIEAVWKFSPNAPTQHLFKVPCLISALDDTGGASGREVVRQLLTVSGVGSSGQIRAEPEVLDFGPVLVGQSRRRQLALVNSSAVDLFYEVTFERTSNSAMEEPGEGERVGCSKPSGLVPARNSVYLQVEIDTYTRGDVEYAVMCTLAPGDAAAGYGGTRSSLGPPVQLSLVRARAEYPTLQVVDVRLAGSPQELLWEQLALADVNRELRTLLSDAEKQLVSETGAPPDVQLAPAASLFRTVRLNLPPGRLGEADLELRLLMRNTGLLPAKWSIKYPNEADLQVPHWADASELSRDELKQAMVVDRGIITVHPRKGETYPGSDTVVTIRMSHVAPDEFELPLVLTIESGKRLVLNVCGRTLAPREPYLHLPHREVLLGPTPLGLAQPHRHTLELPNFSDVPLAYELDTTQLAALNQQSFAVEVISCLEPSGVIPPGGRARIPFSFHPIEAREYTLAVPLLVGDAERPERIQRVLRLKALGHQPTDGELPAAFETTNLALAPPFQQIKMPEHQQAMRLSLDRCVFGRAPIGTSVRQLVILSNPSESDCDFEWDTSHPLYGVRVTVYPSHGTVAAGKHACCKVTMIGAGPAENVRLTLACNLMPQWTEEQAAAHATAAAEAAAKAEAQRSGRKSVTVTTPKPRGILALQAMEERQQRIAQQSVGGRSSSYSVDMTPPQQALLLDLSANFLPAESLKEAGIDLRGFYVPRVLPPTPEELAEFGTMRSLNGVSKEKGVSDLPSINAEQRSVSQSIVQQMLQELMRCDDVKHAFELAPLKPIPWFAQIAHAERGVAPSPVVIVQSSQNASASKVGGPADGHVGLNPELEASLAAGAARAQEETRELPLAKAEEERVAEIKASAELQELAAYVLEGTLFNLVTEASHGEFSLDVVPRQVIKPREAMVQRKL